MTNKINQEEEIINFVQKINDDIKKFIRNSVEASVDYEKRSTMPGHFDPQILQAFKDTHEKFEEIYEAHKD